MRITPPFRKESQLPLPAVIASINETSGMEAYTVYNHGRTTPEQGSRGRPLDAAAGGAGRDVLLAAVFLFTERGLGGM